MFSFTLDHMIDFIALFMIYLLVFLPKWKREERYTLLIRTVMFVYLSFVLFFTMMPIITSIPFIFNHPYAFNLIPFVDYVKGRGDFMRQIILNVIMTIPFGLLFPMTQKQAGRTLVGSTFATFLFSLSIEILQPFINGFRTFDVTDLITNTIGGVIGYCCFMIIRPIIEHIERREHD